jgi:hypothetical protein
VGGTRSPPGIPPFTSAPGANGWGQPCPWFERAIAAAEQGDIHGRVSLQSLGTSLHQVGVCLSRRGQFEAAQPWFKRAVAAAEQGDIYGRVDHQTLGTSLHQVGYCLSSRGRSRRRSPGLSAPSPQKSRATYTAASITRAWLEASMPVHFAYDNSEITKTQQVGKRAPLVCCKTFKL